MKYRLTIRDASFIIKSPNIVDAVNLANQFISLCDDDEGIATLSVDTPIQKSFKEPEKKDKTYVWSLDTTSLNTFGDKVNEIGKTV